MYENFKQGEANRVAYVSGNAPAMAIGSNCIITDRNNFMQKKKAVTAKLLR